MDLIETGTLFLAILISYMFLISTWNNMYRRGKLPPGPTPLPIIGNLLQMKWGETVQSLMRWHVQYGDVYTVYLGSRRVVVLCGYDAVKEALVDQAEEFSGRGELPTVDRFFQGFGVILSNGERWKQLRRFSLVTLRNFGMGKRSIEERIQEEAQCLIEDLRKRKGLSFDPSGILNSAVSNVICSIVFNDRFDYEDEKFIALIRTFNEIFEHMSSIWGQLQDMFPGIMNYVPGPHKRIITLFNKHMEFISERVKINQESLDPTSPRDYIDCFLIQMEKEKQNPVTAFSMRNLLMSVENLFFAGTETVSTTLRYGILILLKHPEIEEKLHEEIDRVIDRNRCPVAEDRSKMPFMDAVIHEIQRFIDLFPTSVPHSVIRDTQFRGFTIPQGTDVYPMLCSVLRDSKQFMDPDKFNPGHFLDDKGGFKKHDAFMPFSTGKRICLGEGLARMDLFLFFTNILQNFNLRSPSDPKDLHITPRMTGFSNQPPPYQLSLSPR